jgi:aerobic-type carbon monoxide dehydrogenase small subunit (CoxS/CutS family)
VKLKRCARRVIQTNARSAIILSVTFVPSRLPLAVIADGTELVTAEGLARGGKSIEAGAFQCGFRTPGFILITKLVPERREWWRKLYAGGDPV